MMSVTFHENDFYRVKELVDGLKTEAKKRAMIDIADATQAEVFGPATYDIMIAKIKRVIERLDQELAILDEKFVRTNQEGT